MDENKEKVNLEETQNNDQSNDVVINEVENTQPEININDNGNVQPNISIETNNDNNLQIEQKEEIVEDYSLKKPDFVIKSKKDTVAEEVERRNKKIQEKIDKANANYKPNSKFKNFILILFFILLFFFIFFLPDIRTFILSKQNKEVQEEKIINGYLDCNLEKTSEKFDLNYSYMFKFNNNKLYYLSVETSTKGDSSVDSKELKEKYDKCMNLKEQVKELDGVSVNCSNNGGKVINSQTFDYKTLDKKEITAAFVEAEGNYPEYNYGDDMDKIEKKLNVVGYTCKRKSN